MPLIVRAAGPDVVIVVRVMRGVAGRVRSQTAAPASRLPTTRLAADGSARRQVGSRGRAFIVGSGVGDASFARSPSKNCATAMSAALWLRSFGEAQFDEQAHDSPACRAGSAFPVRLAAHDRGQRIEHILALERLLRRSAFRCTTHPKAHRSERLSASRPLACSGAM